MVRNSCLIFLWNFDLMNHNELKLNLDVMLIITFIYLFKLHVRDKMIIIIICSIMVWKISIEITTVINYDLFNWLTVMISISNDWYQIYKLALSESTTSVICQKDHYFLIVNLEI